MTEEIINSDGINVSECCFYNNGKCDNPNGMACNCINNAVCYFKELKRLEFELKVTKADYEASEQENKQMKSALEEIRENLVKLKTNDEDDFTYEYSKIEDKINEVLGNESN